MYATVDRALKFIFPTVAEYDASLSVEQKRGELVRYAEQMKLERPDRLKWLERDAVEMGYFMVKLYDAKLQGAYSFCLATVVGAFGAASTGMPDVSVMSGMTSVSVHQGLCGFARDIKLVLESK